MGPGPVPICDQRPWNHISSRLPQNKSYICSELKELSCVALWVMASSLTVTNTFSSPTLQTLYKKLPIPIPITLSSHFLSNPNLKTLTSLSLSLHLTHTHTRRTFSTRAHSQNGAEPPTHYDFDLFTIGAGSGGVRASRFAAKFGASVAVCELPFSTISSDTTGGVGGT